MKFITLILLCLVLVACSQASASESSIASTPTPLPDVYYPLRGGRSTVYLVMENRTLRAIDSWHTYLALGFTPHEMVTVPDENLADYSFAEPITQFVRGESDPQIYWLLRGTRIPLTSPEDWQHLQVDPFTISTLPDDYLATIPIGTESLPDLFPIHDAPQTIDGLFWQDKLCVAYVPADIKCLAIETGETEAYAVDGHIKALATASDALMIGTQEGRIFKLENDNLTEFATLSGWISKLISVDNALWGIAHTYTIPVTGQVVKGEGIFRITDGAVEIFTPQMHAFSSLTDITIEANGDLWASTLHAGIWWYHDQRWQQFTRFNSILPDDIIHDFTIDQQGRVWASTPFRVTFYQRQRWETLQLEAIFSGNESKVVIAGSDDSVFFAAKNFVGRAYEDGKQIDFSAFDHPYFLDNFIDVETDAAGNAWFIGQKHILVWQQDTWFVVEDGHLMEFDARNPVLTPVPEIPNPQTDYQGYIETWPRPAEDNGRCLHYLTSPTRSELELRENIARLQKMNMKWVLVNYTERTHLLQMAPLFAEAGITVVWRPFVRPYETYPFWQADVRFLRSIGLPPYIQIYNEPSHPQEWGGREIDQALYTQHVVEAAWQVYTAGGYVGLQFLKEEWFVDTLHALQEANLPFERLFYVPHPYGLNRPPEFTGDRFGVQGFQYDADLIAREIGFVPVMIVGEGGWYVGNRTLENLPEISETLHRDYNVALYSWFGTGQLSSGEPLPDYLFAYCNWLIADQIENGAWFDGIDGDYDLTIEAVQNMPAFIRQFSWERPD